MKIVLVVIYASLLPDKPPLTIQTYDMSDRSTCSVKAAQIQKQIKFGHVHTLCIKTRA
jgi:hypothetical protein